MGISKLKPGVAQYWLVAAAGLMWSAVGILLCRLAWGWLFPFAALEADMLGIAGITGALLAYYFGFSKIALRNIERLRQFSGKTCFFAFQEWKSYFLIASMMALGIALRHSPVPKDYLAVVYVTIGGALFLSSFHYYRRLWRLAIHRFKDI